MPTTVFDTLKVNQDLKAAGFNEAQAGAIVRSMAGAFEDTVATKADKRADITAVRADIERLETSTRADIEKLEASTRADIANLKAEFFRALWIQGAGIVALIVGLIKLL